MNVFVPPGHEKFVTKHAWRTIRPVKALCPLSTPESTIATSNWATGEPSKPFPSTPAAFSRSESIDPGAEVELGLDLAVECHRRHLRVGQQRVESGLA